MKIVILGTRGFPNVQGGVEKHCEGLATSLVKLGCEVIVLTRSPYVDKDIKDFKGVKLVALPALKHKSLETTLHTFVGIFVAAFKYRPDILHIQAVGAGLGVPLARLFGLKVVFTSHGSNYEHLKWGRFAKFVLRIGEFCGVKFANKVIVISSNIASDLRSKYAVEATIIPNGVFLPEILQSDEALKKYGLEKRKYVLAVGRFVPEKGFDVLVEAFKEITSGWKLVIVGDADHEDAYSRKLKEKARGNSNIVLTGRLSGQPLAELYSNAGLFVLSSYYEGLPIVLLEAMSYGLSCLVSDIPGNREVKLSEERYFKVGDVQELAGKLREFMGRALSVQEKNAQVEAMAKRYDWARIAEDTIKVYKKVLGC